MEGVDNPTYDSDAPPSYTASTAAGGQGQGPSHTAAAPPQYGQQPYPQPYQPYPGKQDFMGQQQQQQQPQFQQQVPPNGQQQQQYGGQQPYPQPYQPQHQQQQGNVNSINVVNQPAASMGGVIVMAQPPPHYYVNTYMCLACVTFWIINFPFGIFAMIFSCVSMNARDSLDYDDARKWGRASFGCSIAGAFVTATLILVLIIIIAAN